LKEVELLDLVEYIKTSVEILLNLKMEGTEQLQTVTSQNRTNTDNS